MELGMIGGGGLQDIAGAGQRRYAGTPTAASSSAAKGDRVDLTSSEGQLARRVLEALRTMITSPDAGPSELETIQNKLGLRYYDRPAVRYELADRLGGLVDFNIR